MGMTDWKDEDKETVFYHMENLSSTRKLPFLLSTTQGKLQWRKGRWSNNKETGDAFKIVFFRKLQKQLPA